MARKARLRGRIFAWLDFAAVASSGHKLVGVGMEPGPTTMAAASRHRDHGDRNSQAAEDQADERALDTASRTAFIETSISHATANLRRTRLSLAFFPLGVVFALITRCRFGGGRADLIPGEFWSGCRRRPASSPWCCWRSVRLGAEDGIADPPGNCGGSAELRAAYAEEDRHGRAEPTRLFPLLSLKYHRLIHASRKIGPSGAMTGAGTGGDNRPARVKTAIVGRFPCVGRN